MDQHPSNRLGEPAEASGLAEPSILEHDAGVQRPSILEQGEAMVRDTETNTLSVSATVDNDRVAAEARFKKELGRGWSVAAWAQWAREKWSGKSNTSAGVQVEKRW